MDQDNEEIKPEYREADVTPEPVSLSGHSLVHIGISLVCHSCPFEHSYFIPPDMLYKGLDKEGLPILEKL